MTAMAATVKTRIETRSRRSGTSTAMKHSGTTNSSCHDAGMTCPARMAIGDAPAVIAPMPQTMPKGTMPISIGATSRAPSKNAGREKCVRMGRKTTGLLDSRASDLEAQMFGDIACGSGRIQVNATKSDMAIGAHEVERGPRKLRACQFRVIEWIGRNGMDAQQVAEI